MTPPGAGNVWPLLTRCSWMFLNLPDIVRPLPLTLANLFSLHLFNTQCRSLSVCCHSASVSRLFEHRACLFVFVCVREQRNGAGFVDGAGLPGLSLLKHHLAAWASVSPNSPRLHSLLALAPCPSSSSSHPLFSLNSFPPTSKH